MKTLYIDASSGISGDMLISGLLDAGASFDNLKNELSKLHLDSDFSLELISDHDKNIFGKKFNVILKNNHLHHNKNIQEQSFFHSHKSNPCDCSTQANDSHSHEHTHAHSHEHRSFEKIKNIILSSSLTNFVKEKSILIFEQIAKAEAKIHNKPISQVHFHEIGAIDSIVDIVGACICIEELQIDDFCSTKVELGSGSFKCAHAYLNAPSPATSIIAQNFPINLGGVDFEATTPTGAGILATFCKKYEEKVDGKILSFGIGVGTKKGKLRANILKVYIIEKGSCENNTNPSFKKFDTIIENDIVEISTNIDDMSAEDISFLCEKLFDFGALDVWQQSIVMKKNRLASKIVCLAKEEKIQDLFNVFWKHSSSSGLRYSKISREILKRDFTKKDFEQDQVCLKNFSNGKSKLEYEDIKKIALQKDLSLEQVKNILTKINE